MFFQTNTKVLIKIPGSNVQIVLSNRTREYWAAGRPQRFAPISRAQWKTCSRWLFDGIPEAVWSIQ